MKRDEMQAVAKRDVCGQIIGLLFFLFAALAPAFCAANDVLTVGQEVYRRYCLHCHGEKGDGNGWGAVYIAVKPRDFTTGIFQYKSTPGGSLPTDEDIFRVITHGLPRNFMDGFWFIPEEKRRAVIEYIKTFSGRWKKEKPALPVVIPDVPEYVGSPESVLKGKELYVSSECILCHGEHGEGTGPLVEKLKDSWGRKDRPVNFKEGVFNGGSAPRDMFRTLTIGIEGTAMQPFSHLSPGERWHLISYILSLKEAGKQPKRHLDLEALKRELFPEKQEKPQ